MGRFRTRRPSIPELRAGSGRGRKAPNRPDPDPETPPLPAPRPPECRPRRAFEKIARPALHAASPHSRLAFVTERARARKPSRAYTARFRAYNRTSLRFVLDAWSRPLGLPG